jgi:multidrug transporter EmrE-like cation transporter
MHPYLWLLLSVISFGFGEYISKLFSLKPSVFLAGIIVVPYVIGVWLWLPAVLKMQSLSVAGTIWNVMSTVVTVAIGVIVFKEHLTYTTVLGILFALTSIVLLSH